MSFLQKIYYLNKPLLLTDDEQMIAQYPNLKVFRAVHNDSLKEAVTALESEHVSGILFLGKDKAALEKDLLWSFYSLHSAGGVTVNEKGEVLMIFRRGKWDLPKGKQDEGEDIETCALREVKEETGINQVRLGERICNTLHIYKQNGLLILKHTLWFRMFAQTDEKLVPQSEENIEEVRWAKPAEIPGLLSKSFETIGDVLREAKIL